MKLSILFLILFIFLFPNLLYAQSEGEAFNLYQQGQEANQKWFDKKMGDQ